MWGAHSEVDIKVRVGARVGASVRVRASVMVKGLGQERVSGEA